MADYTIDWGLPKPEADDLIAGTSDNLRTAIGALAEKADQQLTQVKDQAVADASWNKGALTADDNLDVLIGEADQGVWQVPGSSTSASLGVPEVGVGILEVLWVWGAANPMTIQTWSPQDGSEWSRSYFNGQWSAWRKGSGDSDKGSLTADDDIDTMYTRDHAGDWRVESSSRAEALGLPLPTFGSYTGILTVDWITSENNPWTIQTWRPFDGSIHTRSYGQGSWSAWRSVTRDVTDLTRRVRDLEGNGGNGATNGIDPARLIAPLESRIADIALWGDSNLQSGGTATRLRELLPDSDVHNYARSGQYAALIAARQGGVQALITVEGNTIPASGSVAVETSIRLLYQTARPALSIEGALAGVHGTLSVAAGTHDYTFQRSEPGDPVTIDPETPFWTDIGGSSRDAVSIFWVGGNNPELGVHEYNLAMAAHLTPAHKRFIVMPCINLAHETIGTQGYEDNMVHNRAGAEAFGDRWLDHRTWLIHNGLDAAGITPTQEDLDAIAGDAMPPSLTSDGAHFTGTVQRIIGDLIYEKMQDLDWVS